MIYTCSMCNTGNKLILLQENSPKKDEERPSTSMTVSTGEPLADIQSSPTPSPEDRKQSIIEIFAEEARRLKCGETLTKCPRCGGPALVFKEAKRGKCKRKLICNFDFCMICELEFHGGKECLTNSDTSKRLKSKVKINFAKSKQNLRRL